MYQYSAHYGALPPAYVADENGQPMHSWRVLLLPYIERQDLYDAYDFSEPWYGPNNRKLAALPTPDLYRCPSDPAPASHTSYVVVTGPETAFPYDASTSLGAISAADGTDKTLLLVEVAASGIHWMQPRDLDVEEMSFRINDRFASSSIRSLHIDRGHRFANAVMADGSTRLLPATLNPQTLHALLTIDGREPLPPDF